MPKFSFRASFDIAGALREAMDNISLDGLGPDGTSEYEISDVETDVDKDGEVWTVTVHLDRQAGKFVSADELEAAVTEGLDQIDVKVDYL